jgi:hypothetical protein
MSVSPAANMHDGCRLTAFSGRILHLCFSANKKNSRYQPTASARASVDGVEAPSAGVIRSGNNLHFDRQFLLGSACMQVCVRACVCVCV